MLFYVFRARRFNRYVSHGRMFTVSYFTSLLRIGGPMGFTQLMEVTAFAFAGLMMGWLSAEAIAAHQVAITCAATAFMFPLGLGVAICIRVGHAYGARQFEQVRQIGVLGLWMGGIIMAACGVVFVFGAKVIASGFLADTEVRTLQITVQLLYVAAIFQIVDGVQVVGVNALRGISDVRIPAAIAILAYWVIAVPAGYLLSFRGGFGPVGIWIGLAIGLGVAAVFLAVRFRRLAGRHLLASEAILVQPTV